MKFLCIFLIFEFYSNVYASLEGNCELEGVGAQDWVTEFTNKEVDDNESKEFKRFKAVNVSAVSTSASIHQKYFLVTLEEDTVVISPSAEFINIETHENSDTRAPTIIVNLIFTCKEGSGILVFYQPINDLNTYEPTFSKASYSYTVPMPLPPNFDMSCLFGEHIEACDNDITNTKLSFTISPPEDFSVVWEATTDDTKKCHRAVVKTLQSLSLSGPKDYILSATDTGTPTKTGMAQLRIEVNKEESIPANPRFTWAYYTASYNIDNDLHTVSFDSTIILERNDQAVTYSLEGAHKNNFELQSTSEGPIIVKLTKNLPDEVLRDYVIILLTVEATVEKAEAPGRTALVIYLPKREFTTPEPTTCPETVTPTECPACTTVPSTTISCPPCITDPPTITEGPTTCEPCPTTACPPCSTTASPECPNTCEPTVECPTTQCPPCLSSPSPECPITCETPSECPATECTTHTSGPPVECPATECPPCLSSPSPECPVTCETPAECPVTECTPCTTATSATSCPSSPVTPCPECPTTCEPTVECPITQCPPCLSSPSPECPITCETPTECPTTECTPCTTHASECPATECPPCLSSPSPECPVTCETPAECPVTECTTYTTDSSAVSTQNPLCPITPCPTTCEPTVECPVTECQPCLSSPSSECPITCETPAECPGTECPPCTTTTSSECPGACETSTECGITECPPCLNTPSPNSTECSITECPPCPTTPYPPIPTLTFEQENYIFTIPPVESITVGVVRAYPNTQENVQYTLHASDGATIPNQLKISESSGRLTVAERLEIGTYKVKVIATGVTSKATDAADVVINVVSEEPTTYSVIVKEISELSEATINLPCAQTETTCVYEFDYQYPETTPPLFTVENNVLKSSSINLQMDALKDLLVPQFTVNLKLRPTAPKLRNLTLMGAQNINFEEDVRKWVLLPKHLLRQSDSLLVSVIINDVNNNPPIFKEGSKLLIGYPVKKLARQLSLARLVQVTATDADLSPLNSDIRYSTDSSNFIVHPISGVIYPGEDAFGDNKGERFKVVARDRAGGENALSATLEVEVTLLEKDHLTVLKVANKLLEDVNEIIETLSVDSNMKIGYLTASIESPSYSVSRMLRNLVMLGAPRAEPAHSLSIVIYAFNSDNEVIPTKTVQSNLEGAANIEVDPWTPSIDSDTNVEPTSTGGFIAAIAVLGVLLVLFMIGIGLLYYFKIRKFNLPPKPYKSMIEEDAESTKSARDENPIEDLTKRRPTGYVFNPPPPEDDDNRSDENNRYTDISDKSRDWSGASTPFSKISNENKLDYLGKINNEIAQHQHTGDEDVDDVRDQKKAVSFKPTVQKINILVDEEKQENDDSDISERL